LFHVSGLFSQFLMNLRGGRGIVMMYKWVPEEACELIEKEQISVVMGAPSMVLELLECDAFDRIDASNLINISGGGAATPTKMTDLMRAKATNALPGSGWGMTESGATGTSITGLSMLDKPGTSGFVHPVVELRFCDEDGNEVAKGTPGEIWIKTPAGINGYCNAPEANATEFQDGWFKSGDIGYLDEDGCMFICDRAKDLVIRGGENIYPVEVENCVQHIPGVERSAAFAIPSEKFGEELAMVIKLKADAELSEAEVQAFCKERLSGFKVPSAIKFTHEDLPVNATSKVIKKAVREKFFPIAEPA
jgi:acyl-CoA synthetase (AMP-forming)/AMP-acid ligase II